MEYRAQYGCNYRRLGTLLLGRHKTRKESENVSEKGRRENVNIPREKDRVVSLCTPDEECFLIVRLSFRTSAFLDMHVDSADTNNVYVATNSTDVMHVTCIGNRTNPLAYKPAEISESLSPIALISL